MSPIFPQNTEIFSLSTTGESTTTTCRRRGIAKAGRVFHAINAQGIATQNWYSRVTLKSDRQVLNLGLSKTAAEGFDLEARAKLRAGLPINELKSWLKEQTRSQTAIAISNHGKADPAPDFRDPLDSKKITLRDIMSAHAAAYFEAQPETTARYRASLLNLVETAVRHRQGLAPVKRSGQRVNLAAYVAVLDLPVEVLDDTLVADFQAARLAKYERKSLQELSAKRSANTELRQARCVLSAEAKITFRKAKLILPDLTSFLTAPRFTRVLCHPRLPTDETLDSLFTALGALRHEHESIFTVIAMALYAGLRRAEIFYAKTAWLNSSSGPALCVRFEEGFRPKNATERTIPIPQWLFDYLKQASPHAYLSLTDSKCRAAILKQAVAWLRDHGFQTYRKPLHSLRALYAAYLIATEANPFRIKTRLGHADLTTTFRYYADEPLAENYCGQWNIAVGGSSLGASSLVTWR